MSKALLQLSCMTPSSGERSSPNRTTPATGTSTVTELDGIKTQKRSCVDSKLGVHHLTPRAAQEWHLRLEAPVSRIARNPTALRRVPPGLSTDDASPGDTVADGGALRKDECLTARGVEIRDEDLSIRCRLPKRASAATRLTSGRRPMDPAIFFPPSQLARPPALGPRRGLRRPFAIEKASERIAAVGARAALLSHGLCGPARHAASAELDLCNLVANGLPTQRDGALR